MLVVVSSNSNGPNLGERVRRLSVNIMDKIGSATSENTGKVDEQPKQTTVHYNLESKSNPDTPVGDTIRRLSASLLEKISLSHMSSNQSPIPDPAE